MSQNKSIFLKPEIFYHAIYWILNVLFFTLIFWSRNGYIDFFGILHENAAYLPMGMVFTYFSVIYLIPNFFLNNRITTYIILQILVLMIYPICSNIVSTYYVSPVIYNTKATYGPYNGFLSIILILVFDIVPLAGVKILSQFRKDALLRQKTELEKTEAELKLKEAELKLLKGQIHPHFLFNTLNNIYSLSLEKSDKTPDLLIRLADMLSYIIYDCNSEKVPLAKEIDFINSFLELQRVRYDACKISFKLDGDLNNQQIAPMILHTFIDNSFKHGAEKDSGNPWIKISIVSKKRMLFFTVINSTKQNDVNDNKASGIGISNAIKRLELIYPDRHDLVINKSCDRYAVVLKLEL
jgi:two-component system LytT family sensor kinase